MVSLPVQAVRRALPLPLGLALLVAAAMGLVRAMASSAQPDRPASTFGAKLEEEIAQAVSERNSVAALGDWHATAAMNAPQPDSAEVSSSAAALSTEVLVPALGMPPEAPALPVEDGATCAAAADSCSRRTPLTEMELAEALRSAYMDLYGRPPPIDRLACAWAQCALETSRGSLVFEYNLGNITTVGAWNRSCVMRYWERSSAETDVWAPIDLRFRAYESAKDGATDYWRLMVEHYHSALAMCDEGDIMAAGLRLGQLGYFTAHATPYAISLVRLYEEARGRVLPNLPRIPKSQRRPRSHGAQGTAVVKG